MRPPFDIHVYGERVLDKLSSDADGGGCMTFADVVSGQTKHDVARTFSALLQLVIPLNMHFKSLRLQYSNIVHYHFQIQIQ